MESTTFVVPSDIFSHNLRTPSFTVLVALESCRHQPSSLYHLAAMVNLSPRIVMDCVKQLRADGLTTYDPGLKVRGDLIELGFSKPDDTDPTFD
jgi:hypothetical protein